MLAAYLMSSALGVLTAADLGADVGATGWAVWLLAAAAGIVAGLVIVKRRPLAGTITSCLGALFGIGAFSGSHPCGSPPADCRGRRVELQPPSRRRPPSGVIRGFPDETLGVAMMSAAQP